MLSPSDQVDDDNDEWTRFPDSACLVDDRDSGDKSNGNGRLTAAYRKSIHRDWGLPSFQDQMDWGIRTFQLSCLADDVQNSAASSTDQAMVGGSEQFSLKESIPDRAVIIHLEHRLHSTGSDLWDSALVLAHALPRLLPAVLEPSEWTQWRRDYSSYIQHKKSSSSALFNNITALELGSGTGAVGLYCANCLGLKYVILSDQRDNLALIRKNCIANHVNVASEADGHDHGNNNHSSKPCPSQAVVTLCALDWTNSILPPQVIEAIQDKGLDLIIGSDLFLPFAPDLLVHLAKRLAQILSLCHAKRLTLAESATDVTRTTVAILAYEERFDCSAFFSLAESLSLNVEEVDSAWLHPKFQDADCIHVLRITYK